MDWEIGEIRQINNEWYQCLESNNCRCDYCELNGIVDCCKIACMSNERIDNKDVCFKKLEKVGKPYNDCGTILQRFKIYTNVTNADTKGLELHIYSNNTIGIEVKQIKEDMEENKAPLPKDDNPLTRAVYTYVNGKISDKELIKLIKEMSDEYPYDKNNLKPFSLEAAKAGKPVYTRDGRKARIICFDAKGDYPIVALIERLTENGNIEGVEQYTIDGHCTIAIPECYGDLMMLPEKKEGWIKVKKDVNLYDTKEEADRKMIGNTDYVSAKVEWEE